MWVNDVRRKISVECMVLKGTSEGLLRGWRMKGEGERGNHEGEGSKRCLRKEE